MYRSRERQERKEKGERNVCVLYCYVHVIKPGTFIITLLGSDNNPSEKKKKKEKKKKRESTVELSKRSIIKIMFIKLAEI